MTNANFVSPGGTTNKLSMRALVHWNQELHWSNSSCSEFSTENQIYFMN